MSAEAIRPLNEPPRRLGRYEVLSRLGCGAMGVVYLGRLQSVGGFERLFAIKVLHQHLAQKPQLVAMLLNEARLAAQIQHPNVVGVVDAEISESGEHFVVMDYIDGFTLCELLDHPRLDAVRRVRLGLRVLLDAASGLDAAHRQCNPSDGSPLRIVHRDVSPSNILASLQGAGMITDFGIARVAAHDTDSMPGVIKGTPCYMAPEQVSGSESLDARADVWSLGAVLWEVLTGEQLFYSPAGVGGVFSLVLKGEILAPSERNSRLPAALDAVCLKALERDTERRYGSVRELAEALERVAREHDLIASTHETTEALAQLFAEQIERRRSWLPPAPKAAENLDQSGTKLGVGPKLIEAMLAQAAAPAATAAPAPAAAAPAPATAEASALAALIASEDAQFERDLARLPLRRPPWLLVALAALAIAAVALLLRIDALRSSPRLSMEPSQPHVMQAREHALNLDLSGDSQPSGPDAQGSTRNVAFAPGRTLVHAARGAAPAHIAQPAGASTRARGESGENAPELEPNPYLLAR